MFNIFFKKRAKKQKNKQKKEKNKKVTTQYVKICPKCGSVNVKISNQGGAAGIIFGMPTIYKCLNCGYANYAFPEININEINVNETDKKR